MKRQRSEAKFRLIPASIVLLLVCICIYDTQRNVLCLQRPFSPRYSRLRRYNVDPRLVSVSGFSSGASFAVQMGFIYSSLISGVGVFSGSAYPVAYLVYSGQLTNLLKIDRAYPVIEKWSRQGLIDPVSNLRRTRVYVFQGKTDPVPTKFLHTDIIREFKHFGSSVETSSKKVNSGHCVPTNNFPLRGDYFPIFGSADGLCNAGYQGVNHMFAHFYGPATGAAFVWLGRSNATLTGQLFKFDQNEFTRGDFAEGALLAGSAFIYVPRNCQWGQHVCKLHLVFHGTGQPQFNRIMTDGHNGLAHSAGYLQAADANNVIVLFPETSVLNVAGWDIVGITGKAFLWKNGTHPKAVAKMILRVVYGL